jgi:hypothetical protein
MLAVTEDDHDPILDDEQDVLGGGNATELITRFQVFPRMAENHVSIRLQLYKNTT